MQLIEKHISHDFSLVKVCVCDVSFIYLYQYLLIYTEREGGTKEKCSRGIGSS